MSKNKTNPKKIPRSQRDVDDAYRLGVYKGTEVTLIVFLRSLCDIVDDVDIVQLYDKFESGLDSIRRGDTKLYDEKQAIEEEYNIRFESLLQHFGFRSKF